MSADDPIDVDEYGDYELKVEDEGLDGKVKSEEDKSDSPEPKTFKLGKKGKLPYARGSNRRHPEDADTEDKVLVALVDSGGWNAVAGHFPNVSLQALKKRYANMKAKLFKWTPEEDARLSKFVNQCNEEKWRSVAQKMGMTIKACKHRAEKLGLK